MAAPKRFTDSLHLRLPKETREKLERIADAEGVSIASKIVQYCEIGFEVDEELHEYKKQILRRVKGEDESSQGSASSDAQKGAAGRA
jgi:predicted DNA-binding protein